MNRMFATVIFSVGGLLASGAVVYWLHELTGADAESKATEFTQSGPKSGVDFSNYHHLWNAGGAGQSMPIDTRTVVRLWEETLRSGHTAGSTAPIQLHKAAQTDTAHLLQLLQIYEREQDHNSRALLKSILFGIQKPEVVRFALRLTESANPLHRIEGFELLAQLPAAERELRQAALKAINTEDDPLLLRSAISALNPKLAPPIDVAQVTAKLHQLAQHADIEVRRQSIMLLSKWDRSANMESRFELAFNDPSFAVRLAAIWALRDSSLRSDNIKYGLIKILHGDEEYTRQAALYMLRSFSLTKEESELHRQVNAELNPR